MRQAQQILFENVHKNVIHILFISFLKLWGWRPKIIPWGPQYVKNAIFMTNIIKTHQLEHAFFNFSGSVTHSKSVARCVAIINLFCNKQWYFLRLNLIKITHQKRTKLHPIFKIFSWS